MVSLSHPKSPISLHIFSTMNKSSTPSSSSSSLTTMKLKTLIHNLIFSHICRVVRALSKAKSVFLELFKENQLMCMKPPQRKDHKYMKKILFGSFRLHYNWCSASSHVMPIPSSPILEGISIPTSHIYYDSTWNSVFSTDDLHDDNNQDQFCNSGCYAKEEEGQLSSYLQWLEEKSRGKHENSNGEDGNNNADNEIDKLADMFIANCHEKFRLEKIESYRRYQEMLARSM